MIRRGGSGARVQEVVERTGARSSRSSAAPVNTIQALAQELVGLQPDIILASSVPATAALQRETRTIPIVFASVADPSASSRGSTARVGTSPASPRWRPRGGGGKWPELLSEIAPGLKRAAIMFNPETAPISAYMPAFEMAARSLKVTPVIAPVHSDAEIDGAVSFLFARFSANNPHDCLDDHPQMIPPKYATG